MMMIDLTAQLSPLAMVLNVLLVIAGAALVAKALSSRTAFSASVPGTASASRLGAAGRQSRSMGGV